MKYLLIAFALLVLYWWLIRPARRDRTPPPPPAETSAGEPAAGKRMVRCAQCGVHLPQGEALVTGERFYCCEEHRAAGDR